jgi:hypothetical protein
MSVPRARGDIHVLVWVLRQVEVCFGVHRVQDTGRHFFVLFSCRFGWLLLLLLMLLMMLLLLLLLLLLLWLMLLVLLLRSLRQMRRRKLHRRQGHILRQVLRVVHEALLELHALLPHMLLLLLLLLGSMGLLHLLLLFLSFFLL